MTFKLWFVRYILVRMENPPKAESLLEAALRMNGDCEIALFNLGIIAHRYYPAQKNNNLESCCSLFLLYMRLY